jgi:hypothetical protein
VELEPLCGKGAGTPDGVGGAMGGMLLGVGGYMTVWLDEVVVACIPEIVVLIAISSRR